MQNHQQRIKSLKMVVQTSGKNQYSYIYILNIFLYINNYIFFWFDWFVQLLNATHLLVMFTILSLVPQNLQMEFRFVFIMNEKLCEHNGGFTSKQKCNLWKYMPLDFCFFDILSLIYETLRCQFSVWCQNSFVCFVLFIMNRKFREHNEGLCSKNRKNRNRNPDL